MANIKDLLQIIPADSPRNRINAPVREIDAILHQWDSRHYGDVNPNLDEHLQHQYNMIEMLNGNEREVFNSNRAYNGKTGAVTDMLRACYFIIYSHLILDVGLEYDKRDIDRLVTILLEIGYHEGSHSLELPPEEFDAIIRIISVFKQSIPKSHYFKNEWWDGVIASLKETAISIKDKPWYKDVPPKERYGGAVMGAFESTMKKNKLEPLKQDGGSWESHPIYITSESVEFNMDNIEYDIARLNYLKELFVNPNSDENINSTRGGSIVRINKRNTRRKLKRTIRKKWRGKKLTRTR
jgi:hypothetical protein